MTSAFSRSHVGDFRPCVGFSQLMRASASSSVRTCSYGLLRSVFSFFLEGIMSSSKNGASTISRLTARLDSARMCVRYSARDVALTPALSANFHTASMQTSAYPLRSMLSRSNWNVFV